MKWNRSLIHKVIYKIISCFYSLFCKASSKGFNFRKLVTFCVFVIHTFSFSNKLSKTAQAFTIASVNSSFTRIGEWKILHLFAKTPKAHSSPPPPDVSTLKGGEGCRYAQSWKKCFSLGAVRMKSKTFRRVSGSDWKTCADIRYHLSTLRSLGFEWWAITRVKFAQESILPFVQEKGIFIVTLKSDLSKTGQPR